MLYLDTKRKIHSIKPDNFLCEVESEIWEMYEFLEEGVFWQAENEEFLILIQPDEFEFIKTKEAKLKENEQKRKVEFITISLGKMKTETPLGDLKTALPLYEKLAKFHNGLPEGAVRLYDEQNNVILSPALTYQQVEAIMLEISMAYIQIDQKSTLYTQAIKNAQNIDELNNITIEYP